MDAGLATPKSAFADFGIIGADLGQTRDRFTATRNDGKRPYARFNRGRMRKALSRSMAMRSAPLKRALSPFT